MHVANDIHLGCPRFLPVHTGKFRPNTKVGGAIRRAGLGEDAEEVGPLPEWQAFDADCAACSLFNPIGNSGGRFGATEYW